MGKYLLVLLLITTLIAGGCAMQQTAVMERPADDVLRNFSFEMVQAHNQFGFNVYRHVPERSGNIMVSPVSLSLAFAMALNGADRETEQEMAELLGLERWDREVINQHLLSLQYYLRTADPEVVLDIANSAWLKEGVPFDESYIVGLQKYLLARAETLDFSDAGSADIINNWVNQQTRGMIPSVVEPPINPLTILFLINAIYFDGNWTHQFNHNDTVEDAFTNLNGTQTMVPMMKQTDSFTYHEDEKFQMIRIPYGQEKRVSMNVILPRPGMDWEEFSKEWTPEIWQAWRNLGSTREGILTLPRFEFSYEISLVDTLKEMGLNLAFDPAAADFSRMIDPAVHNDVHISNVVHKTRIKVSEEGTEAAAVTSIEVGVTSIPMYDFEMRVDRPFLFVIEDSETGSILFMGHVTNL